MAVNRLLAIVENAFTKSGDKVMFSQMSVHYIDVIEVTSLI